MGLADIKVTMSILTVFLSSAFNPSNINVSSIFSEIWHTVILFLNLFK